MWDGYNKLAFTQWVHHYITVLPHFEAKSANLRRLLVRAVKLRQVGGSFRLNGLCGKGLMDWKITNLSCLVGSRSGQIDHMRRVKSHHNFLVARPSMLIGGSEEDISFIVQSTWLWAPQLTKREACPVGPALVKRELDMKLNATYVKNAAGKQSQRLVRPRRIAPYQTSVLSVVGVAGRHVSSVSQPLNGFMHHLFRAVNSLLKTRITQRAEVGYQNNRGIVNLLWSCAQSARFAWERVWF